MALDSLLRPPIAFAHRGARAHAPENTVEAFALALRMGATGLETDAWVTSDGQVVLDHDGTVRVRGRKKAIADVPRSSLPGSIPTLGELYAACGTAFELSIDVKDPAAATGIVDAARAAGGDAAGRLWLCHHDWELVATWRGLGDDVRLVDSTRLKRMKGGPERRAADLAAAGIDAVNLHHTDWSGGLTTLFHRFRRYTFGWDAQFERIIAALLGMGIDGVYSDHTDRLAAVLAEFHR